MEPHEGFGYLVWISSQSCTIGFEIASLVMASLTHPIALPIHGAAKTSGRT
jgi:hypothetical protein